MPWVVVVLLVTAVGISEDHPVYGRLLVALAGLAAIGHALVTAVKWVWEHPKTRKPAGVVAVLLGLLAFYLIKDPGAVWDWLTNLISELRSS